MTFYIGQGYIEQKSLWNNGVNIIEEFFVCYMLALMLPRTSTTAASLRMAANLFETFMSIPGISYTLAAIILSEIGDIHRFDTPSKLLAFAGMEPSTYQSGKYNASNTPMVKRGSSYLRWAILTAARLVAMRDKTFRDFMLRKKSEGKHHFVAITHVGKKLIRVIFHMLKTGSAFVPQS